MANVYRLVSRWGNLFLALGSIVIFGTFAALFFWGRGTTEALSNQFQDKEKVIARSGSGAITSFFSLTGKSLEFMARSPVIYDLEPQSQDLLQAFIDSWKETPLVGVIVADADGQYKYIANRQGAGIDSEVSATDREYFMWSKTAPAGEVHFSPPVVSRQGASKGQYITPVSVALRNSQGEYQGVLTAAISMPRVTTQYLEGLKLGKNSSVYLVHRDDGLIIYASNNEFIGKSVIEAMGGQSFLGKDYIEKIARVAISKDEEGSIKVALPGKDLKLEPYLISWNPITAGNLKLHLVIVTAEGDALQLISPFYVRNIVLLYVGFVLVAIVLVRFAKKRAYLQALEDEHRLHEIETQPQSK